MSSLAGAARRRIVRDSLLLPVIFFLSPLATSLAPRLTTSFVAIAALTMIGSALRRGLAWQDLFPRRSAFAVCLIFAAYVFINASWSIDPLAGVGKAALLAGLFLITFAAVHAASSLDGETLHPAAMAFAAGAFLGALLVLVELLTAGALTRTVVAWFPQLVSPKHFKKPHGILVALNLSKLDQNVNLTLFHLWPGVLALASLANARKAVAIALFFAVIATVIAVSHHDSSQIAIAASSVVVLVAWKWPAAMTRTLAVCWLAAFVLVLPASFAAFESGLHQAKWLPKSARARVILWDYTAEQTLNRPLFGVGVDSTPRISLEQKSALGRDRPEGFVVAPKTGHHAHDIFLQSWYELGAVGALLLAIAGASVALLMLLLPQSAQPFAAGAFAAFAIIGAFAWGMWQSWFMCAVALLPIYLRIATPGPRESRSDFEPPPRVKAAQRT